MRAGAARVDITPSLPVDVLGYVRRPVAPRRVRDPLLATGAVIDDGATTVVIIAADLVNLAPGYADRVRERVADAVGCPPSHVLLNSSHTHAGPWPGATVKLGGAQLDHGVLVGRADKCFDSGLRAVLDVNVSRAHLLLLREGGACWAFDTCSTQGTWHWDGARHYYDRHGAYRRVRRIHLAEAGTSLSLSRGTTWLHWHPSKS